ncbi:MAG: hypothetical protein HN548_09190 [Opitutae bacterium]|mgnify:FL=1|jgi:hypothetical protein|nr:hypothetical protein [Opitutae bacterium]MBT5717714.1 hypothetical protein [Opitutae bacterium]
MNLRKEIFCLLPLTLSLWLWVKDGYRFAFWLTSVEEKKEVPIIDGMPELGTQTQIIWKDQFVSGIETPLLGVLLTSILFLILLNRINSNPNKKKS